MWASSGSLIRSSHPIRQVEGSNHKSHTTIAQATSKEGRSQITSGALLSISLQTSEKISALLGADFRLFSGGYAVLPGPNIGCALCIKSAMLDISDSGYLTHAGFYTPWSMYM